MNVTGKSMVPQQESSQLKRLPITAFFVGSAISYVGDILTLLAIPWFVLLTTGSVTKTGITAFFSTIPSVFSAFFGSIIIDRLGYKRTSVIGDIASAIAVMLVPLLYHTVGLAFWQLLALVFLGGLLKSPGVTARSSMVPELAKMANMRLERANALSDGINRVSHFIGAPLAGVLIALIGTSNLLWFDGISFVISALLIGLAVPATPPILNKEEKRPALSGVWQGLRFIQRDTFILSIVVTVMITNLLDAAFFSVIEPAYIKHIFNSAVPLGLIIAALGGASFVGTLIFGAIGHRLPRRWTFSIGYTIGGASRFWAFLLLPILPFLIVWHILAGLFIAPINPLLETAFQEKVPEEMRARVFGVLGAGFLAGIPIGTFLSGFFVSWVGLQVSILAIGIIYLLTTLSLFVNPAMKEM
ncbi:MAG TPA: MFS transporter [Ktedonobacteraceae bacterium]|jgi:MFS family permease|nr:MFS transporter [Ktedonobacteraceae bacterium]